MTLMGKYDTIDKARIAMHMDIILAMNETNRDESWIGEVRNAVNGQQFNDNFSYDKDDHSDAMGIYASSAWANFHDDHYDWEIFEI
jgi:hypothetical protein